MRSTSKRKSPRQPKKWLIRYYWENKARRRQYGSLHTEREALLIFSCSHVEVRLRCSSSEFVSPPAPVAHNMQIAFVSHSPLALDTRQLNELRIQ